MSAIGLVNLAQALSNQSTAQGPDTQTVQKTAGAPGNPATQGLVEDQFTPSAQNSRSPLVVAQAAGLFSVTQSAFFSPAANVLLQQNTPAVANLTAAPLPVANPNASATPVAVATTTVAGAAPAAVVTATQVKTTAVAAAGTNGTAATVNAAPARAVAAPAAAVAPPVPAAQAATPAAAPAANTTTSATAATTLAGAQAQLQALNLALAALGLNTQDINQLDQIASIINDYNPSLFTAQAYQLEALAQKAPAQTPAPTSANVRPAANTTNLAGGNAAAKAAAGGGTPAKS
jgi:hypothetical protein